MAPYNPPIAHYAHIDVSGYAENKILCMIGKEGKGFYWLTRHLGLQYLWYNKEKKLIELWGSYRSLANGAREKVLERLAKM
jgi:hypothetical protein